jgi:hypothetical protein
LTKYHWSLFHLPEYEVLTQWQYDFHLKRLGTFGLDVPFYDNIQDSCLLNDICYDEHVKSERIDLGLSKQYVQDAIMWSNNLNNNRTELNSFHLNHIIEMIESYLLPDANIFHMEVSPLIPLIANKFIKQSVVSTNILLCNKLKRKETGNLILDTSTNPINCYNIREINKMSIIDFEYSLIIIHLSVVESSFLLKQLLQLLKSVEYILVIDLCSSAPTDFSVMLETYGVPSLHNYTFAESICNLDSKDSGAVLYRY